MATIEGPRATKAKLTIHFEDGSSQSHRMSRLDHVLVKPEKIIEGGGDTGRVRGDVLWEVVGWLPKAQS